FRTRAAALPAAVALKCGRSIAGYPWKTPLLPSRHYLLRLGQQRLRLWQAVYRAQHFRIVGIFRPLGGFPVEGAEIQLKPHQFPEPLFVAIEFGVREGNPLGVYEILEPGHGLVVRLPSLGKSRLGVAEVGIAEPE